MEFHSLHSYHQEIFLCSKSTSDMHFYLADLWSSLRDCWKSFVMAIDISEAFDRVWPVFLLSKLSSSEFSSSFSTSNFLKNHSTSAIVNGKTFGSFPIICRVLHGFVLFHPFSYFLSATSSTTLVTHFILMPIIRL